MQDIGVSADSIKRDTGPNVSEPQSLLDQIRCLILSGKFEPGSLVPEATIATDFGVSRTPIREVFKQLEIEGLVEIRPRVGTFVRKATRREITELFLIKEALEGLAAGLMARRGDSTELKILEENVLISEAAVSRGDFPEYARLVSDFHRTIILGAGNAKLVETYDRLMNQLVFQKLVLKTVQTPGRLTVSCAEHRAVLEAIKNNDRFGAELAMRTHVHASSRAALTPTPNFNEEAGANL